MKAPSIAAIIVFSALAAFPASRSSDVERADFLRSRKDHHEWVKGMPVPTTLKEAGLLVDAKLVWTGFYFDGGTRGYLIKDSAGSYLAMCTGPGLDSKAPSRFIGADVGSRFFIGGLHYTHEDVQLVESGSECEQFLKTLTQERKSITDDPANANLMTSRALPLPTLAKQ